MKVALVGNMNNMFFSLMRYLRDLGVDAHLLMFSDEASHFLPENDTWDLNKWGHFIKVMDLKNSEIGLLSNSTAKIVNELSGYDKYIGCGIAPAYFYKANIKLQIFVPYAYGVEFYGYHRVYFLRPLRELVFQIAKYHQRKGIQNNTSYLVSSDKTDYNLKVLNKLKVKTTWLPIPMVYNRENPETALISKKLKDIVALFNEYELILFSHVSHKWKNIPREWNGIYIKKNDILIRGFAEFVESKTVKDPLLVLVDYGFDVNASRLLIKELDIEPYVYWLPLLSRKEIMYLLDFVDIGGAELGGVMWGGTGWEFLSKGVPFFQYVSMTDEEFKKAAGASMPPFLNVKSPQEIKEHLIEYNKDPGKYKQIGKELKKWFNEHNGISLASQYADLLGPDVQNKC